MNNEKYQQGFTDKIETLKQKEDSLIENGVAQHLAGLLNGIFFRDYQIEYLRLKEAN